MTESVIEKAEAVDQFIKTMKWSEGTSSETKTLVEGNIRGFWQFLHSEQLEACEKALEVEEYSDVTFETVVEDIPILVGAASFPKGYGPEELYVVRRDDGSHIEFTKDIMDDLAVKYAEIYEDNLLD